MLQLIKQNFIYKSLIVMFSFSITIAATADSTTLEILAENGNAEAQYELAKIYGIRSDEGFDWYQKAANQDHSEAQNTIGLWYSGQEYGNKFKALEWFTKAANQGHAEAQYMLASYYYSGINVRKNISQAKEWYGIACDNGDRDGCDMYKMLNK